MGSKKRKSYTPEYRREAAHLVIDTLAGRSRRSRRTELGARPQEP